MIAVSTAIRILVFPLHVATMRNAFRLAQAKTEMDETVNSLKSHMAMQKAGYDQQAILAEGQVREDDLTNTHTHTHTHTLTLTLTLTDLTLTLLTA